LSIDSINIIKFNARPVDLEILKKKNGENQREKIKGKKSKGKSGYIYIAIHFLVTGRASNIIYIISHPLFVDSINIIEMYARLADLEIFDL